MCHPIPSTEPRRFRGVLHEYLVQSRRDLSIVTSKRFSSSNSAAIPTTTHPTGQTAYYESNDFTDLWNPHETIVIQHGFARQSAFWYHGVPELSRHCRVIRRVARGHGRSSTPPPSYDNSMDTIPGEIVNTFDQSGLQKVQVLGESTGGIFAEALAG